MTESLTRISDGRSLVGGLPSWLPITAPHRVWKIQIPQPADSAPLALGPGVALKEVRGAWGSGPVLTQSGVTQGADALSLVTSAEGFL